MTRREERCLFSSKLLDLLLWAREFHPEAEIAFDEVTVHSPRKVWMSGVKTEMEDAVHMARSRHHDGCAADLLVFINGYYISDGDHAVYRDLGKRWETMHDRCAWGGRFTTPDPGHFSIAAEDGRK